MHHFSASTATIPVDFICCNREETEVVSRRNALRLDSKHKFDSSSPIGNSKKVFDIKYLILEKKSSFCSSPSGFQPRALDSKSPKGFKIVCHGQPEKKTILILNTHPTRLSKNANF